MKFNLIFEGTDCVGKTSTISELIKILKFKQLIKFDAPKNYNSSYNHNIKTTKILNDNYGIILDRSMFGEEIYGPMFRKYDVKYMRLLEKSLELHNIYILMVANEDILERRFDGEFVNLEQQKLVQKLFKDQFKKSNVKIKFLIDSSNKTPKELAHEILFKIINL